MVEAATLGKRAAAPEAREAGPPRAPRPAIPSTRPDRPADGSTYIFATHTWADTTNDGHAQLHQGGMKPVDDVQLAVWKKAVALPMEPDR
ncbi:hypothetical protein [Streptomyces sp. NPDC056194]|uniref:hypothetical protein n=1 Tax=unclassified Streptomyces TaxID=2593676 RepID=UPI0035D80ED8